MAPPVGRHYFNVLYNVSYLITNQFYFGTEEKNTIDSPHDGPRLPRRQPLGVQNVTTAGRRLTQLFGGIGMTDHPI